MPLIVPFEVGVNVTAKCILPWRRAFRYMESFHCRQPKNCRWCCRKSSESDLDYCSS